MKINLYSDNNRECVLRVKGDIQELDIGCEEFSPDNEIDVECKVLRNNDLIRIDGTVSAAAMFECARCLEPFSQILEGNFSLVARLMRRGETVPQYSEENDEEDNDNLVNILYGEDSLDITEYVHDALLLVIPLKPVCSEDCKGLCPVCGNNLNKHECGCGRKQTDTRWRVLSEFLNDLSDNK